MTALTRMAASCDLALATERVEAITGTTRKLMRIKPAIEGLRPLLALEQG
jgi:hypothetical protein